MKFYVTEEQKIRLQGYLKLMNIAEKYGQPFYLSDFIDALYPDPRLCDKGPFKFIDQVGDLQRYYCKTCKTVFFRRESVPEADWKHYKEK